jgi:molybdenum cofactor cytidylyltransferase
MTGNDKPGQRSGPVWAVVLAAGESKRMGEPKLLLPYGGRTVIEAVLTNVTASSAAGTLVVLGGHAALLEEKLAPFPVLRTFNPGYRDGMLSSVQWGFRSLPANARAALVLLGDQPWVTTATIDRVIGSYAQGTRGLICPAFRGRGGHPLLVDLRYRNEIGRLDPEVGLRGLLVRHPEDTIRLELEEEGILEDLDLPADKAKLSRA